MSSQSAIRVVPPLASETQEPPLEQSKTTTWIRQLAPRDGQEFRLDAVPEAPRLPSLLSPESVAVRLVELFVARGVKTFFGIPGGPVAPLFEAIRLNSAAKLIEVRHESHAAFAATSFYRATGEVPAVLVTAGPGVTNALTGVASAHAEAAPMVVITGDVAWSTHGGRLLQNCGPEGIDIEQVFASVTRRQVRVTNARSALSQALTALEAACDPIEPGPALLVVPIDCATETVQRIHFPESTTRTTIAPAFGTVRRTAELLAVAERPLLVLGGGCLRDPSAVRTLVDVLDVPFVTTPRAKGVVSEDHPRSLRNGGMAASLWARDYTSQGVDVALVLGTDLDDVSVGPTPYVREGGKLIHVDLNSRVFNRNLTTYLGVRADLSLFAQELYEMVLETGLNNPHARKLIKETKKKSAYDVSDFAFDGRDPIPPATALYDLQKAAPDARFTTDIGEHMLSCLHYLRAKGPGDFHIQLGLGSMGSGIAGATGLALSDRDRPVICVCGDGGMQMSGMEILTAKKMGLPIVYAVFNDSRYNMVHHGMKQLFGQAENYDVPDVDFAAWARAMGVPSATVRRGGEISRNLIDSLLLQGGPALLDILIDKNIRVQGGGRVEALQRMSMLGDDLSGGPV